MAHLRNIYPQGASVALTEAAIRAAAPREKAYRLFHGDGLYLEVSPSGGRLWRLKYRFSGKEKLLALGKHPAVTLTDAKDAAIDAKRLLRSGIDPSLARKIDKASSGAAADSFEAVAREWFALRSPGWADTNGPRILSRLERDVFPVVGKLPIAAVTAPMLLVALKRVEGRGATDTAHRIRSYLRQIWRYAIGTGRVVNDPTVGLVDALAKVSGGHMAAITDPKRLGAMLRLTDDYPGTFVVACALKLAPRVFVRPGELRTAEWKDFDLEAGRWEFLSSKTHKPLIVPLATQCVGILRDLHGLTGRSQYVFPSHRSTKRPMSNNAVLVALRSIGVDRETTTGHGFRATARTILDEVLGFPAEIIEAQLGHKVRGPLGAAYNRTTRLPERMAMMQRWSDYLDEIKLIR